MTDTSTSESTLPDVVPGVVPGVVADLEDPPLQVELDLGAMPSGARGAVEAVLMVVDEPVTESALASALGLTTDSVGVLLADLADDYDAAGRGFELRRVASGVMKLPVSI